MRELVKVTFKPWQEVIIHEAMHYPLDDLIKLFSLGIQPGGLTQPLLWAEGVVFVWMAMAPTDDIVKENLEGKLHWLSVQWALKPQYEPFIPIKDINAKIPLINVSANAMFCDVAKALKEQK